MSPDRHEPERKNRPLPEGGSFFTPGASPLRRAVERRSAVPLVVLHNAPRWVLPVGMVGVLFAGLLLAGIAGALLLALLAAFIGWLAFLAWPRLRRPERATRCVVVATLLGLGVLQSGVF
ncbi:DUF6703 family protein [Actinorugispora endophytica]|uniref:Uncharacterized protein n=1 Tax=Actinorugispora endophytica TaxID=1605990 RepID=A0A4R6V104_9ACTN|nr:DUF6703 family protein [Actinorugispora endophytica]TDQ52040.1 hypothetical protein EV190_10821 [Actinorugispora endophytica]